MSRFLPKREPTLWYPRPDAGQIHWFRHSDCHTQNPCLKFHSHTSLLSIADSESFGRFSFRQFVSVSLSSLSNFFHEKKVITCFLAFIATDSRFPGQWISSSILSASNSGCACSTRK